MTRLCACGKPVMTGRTAGRETKYARCLPCMVADGLRGWNYPASRPQVRPRVSRLGRRPPNIKAERNAAIVAAVQGGQPAKAVAYAHGITADMVRKIVRRANAK